MSQKYPKNGVPTNIVEKYYGGKIINDYSAMQGPCDSGYHIPSKDENVALVAALTALGIDTSNGNCMKTYLKMPWAGYRNYSSANVSYQGTNAYYWSYTTYSTDYAYSLQFSSSGLNPQFIMRRPYGFPIRQFKNAPIIPDNTRTTLYGTLSGGIFHNTTDGLISISSDGTNWITIADKNLGATTVYNDGDTLSESNCGKYYQRGNNYGFAWTGSLTTSSTRVDASNYGPGNYYSSSTFITVSSSPYDRSSVQNDDLWGGETGIKQSPVQVLKVYYGGKLVDDYSAMRGPCPEGFHIPSDTEFNNLKTIIVTTLSLSNDRDTAKTYLKLPPNGMLNYKTGLPANGYESIHYYWTRILSSYPYRYKGFCVDGGGFKTINSQYCYGYLIRPFKDEIIIPDSSWTTLYDGSSVATGAGIFHNSTLGLISLSGDGQTWITIADKNLGATTVYNSGDTISESNCGKFYQWGNNYGFPLTGATTTSSTQVDATNYGPGNYYYSDTFITQSGEGLWDSSANRNLRGGETGVQQKPILIWEKKTPEIEYVLIGGGGAGGRSRHRSGGGGGAGGLVYCASEILQPGQYSVVIGAGGTGSNTNCLGACGSGCNSCFDNIVAYGGGGGGGMNSCSTGCDGAPGGSGGGAPGCRTTCAAACDGQGNKGGKGCTTRGGGGGGYLCAGCAPSSNYYGGNGGEGYCSNIAGEYVWYASGGGGGGCTGYSCSCGGGCGGCYRVNGCNATTYGSGGGGGGCTGSSSCCMKGGDGCQGIFIARYPSNCPYRISGGSKYECNGYCIHCFTSDGTLTVN